MHAVSTFQITDILYFNDEGRYQSCLGSVSFGQINEESITNASESDNTQGKYEINRDQRRFQIGK